jgi:septal ring factor EnvC (AmiA/AmiB activator)
VQNKQSTLEAENESLRSRVERAEQEAEAAKKEAARAMETPPAKGPVSRTEGDEAGPSMPPGVSKTVIICPDGSTLFGADGDQVSGSHISKP